MNVNINTSGLWFRSLASGGLKGTQQKMERQAECENKITFFENQKESLKNMQCDTLEAIERKLEMLHSYEDQITAAKQEYNNEQMWHILDEAKERGEKIAEEAEKMKPKTEEERKEELKEEALQTEEEKGELTESMEEISDIVEEVSEELLEETEEQMIEQAEDSADALIDQKVIKKISEEEMREDKIYKRIDLYV